VTVFSHQSFAFYFVIIFYYILLAAVSFYFSKYVKNTSDFYKASGQTPWLVAGLSFFMTAFSASVFVANASFAYNYGLLNILLIVAQLPTFVFGYFIFSKLWHRSKCNTAIEFMERRYDHKTAKFFVWTGIPIRILDNANRIYVTAVLFEVLLGMDLWVAILFTCIAALIYTVKGGFLGIVVTDTLQAIIMMIIVFVVALMAFIKVGGISGFMARVPEGYWTLNPKGSDFNLTLISAWCIVGLVAWNGMWSLVQKYVSVEKETDAQKVAATCGISYFILFPLLAIPPMCAAVLLPELRGTASGAEQSFIKMAEAILPSGLLGLLCFAIFGATVTSLNSELTVISQIAIQDVFKKVLKNVSEKQKLFLGRIIIIVVIALCASIAFAIRPLGGAFRYLINVLGLTTLPTFIPLLLGLIYRRTPAWGSIASFLIGIILSVVLRFIFGVPLGWVIFANGTITACAMLFIGWIWPVSGERKEVVDKLFMNLTTPHSSQPATSKPAQFRTVLLPVFSGCLGLVGIVILMVSLPFMNKGVLSSPGILTSVLLFIAAAIVYAIKIIVKNISIKKDLIN
jgi:SSS family transporter